MAADEVEEFRAELVSMFAAAEGRGMSIEDLVLELADTMGVGRASIYRWRAGITTPLRALIPVGRTAVEKLRKKYEI